MDWLGLFIPRLGRRLPPESLNPPHPDDLDRIDELRHRGSKLRLPHPVRAFATFDGEPAARRALELLEAEGFGCQLRTAEGGRWVLTAVNSLVPTPGGITKLREQMEALCSGLEGHAEYLGWEAPIVY